MISSAAAFIVVGVAWALVWGYVRLVATLLPFFQDRALESRLDALEAKSGSDPETVQWLNNLERSLAGVEVATDLRLKKLETQVVDLQVATGARSMR